MLPERRSDLCCGLLSIWIVGRQFPDATDYWDGNWLNVVAHCSDGGASVTVNGTILHLGEIAAWLKDLTKMSDLLGGTAELPAIEPNLKLKLICDHLGHIQAECWITPDHLKQQHRFTFEIDQSYLPGLIGECNTILQRYPIRDPQQTAK
jgi:hypothetical protein